MLPDILQKLIKLRGRSKKNMSVQVVGAQKLLQCNEVNAGVDFFQEGVQGVVKWWSGVCPNKNDPKKTQEGKKLKDTRSQ